MLHKRSQHVSTLIDLLTVIIIPGAFFACGLIAILKLIIN